MGLLSYVVSFVLHDYNSYKIVVIEVPDKSIYVSNANRCLYT